DHLPFHPGEVGGASTDRAALPADSRPDFLPRHRLVLTSDRIRPSLRLRDGTRGAQRRLGSARSRWPAVPPYGRATSQVSQGTRHPWAPPATNCFTSASAISSTGPSRRTRDG